MGHFKKNANIPDSNLKQNQHRLNSMVFLFRSEFFFRKTQVRIFIFLLQNLTLGYMTNYLIQIIFFFPPPKSEYFFSNIGNQNIFLEKKHTLQVKC